jgi:hypothetical protein
VWNECGNGVKTLSNYTLDMLLHRKPQPYRFRLNTTVMHPNPQSNAHRDGSGQYKSY